MHRPCISGLIYFVNVHLPLPPSLPAAQPHFNPLKDVKPAALATGSGTGISSEAGEESQGALLRHYVQQSAAMAEKYEKVRALWLCYVATPLLPIFGPVGGVGWNVLWFVFSVSASAAFIAYMCMAQLTISPACQKPAV